MAWTAKQPTLEDLQRELDDVSGRAKSVVSSSQYGNSAGYQRALADSQEAWKRKTELQRQIKSMQAADPKSADNQAEANWKQGQELLQRPGPYTPGVIQQLTNRQADQSAAAEAVNADEIRNMAAARGLDPTQALRQGQQQRQAQNLAFSGDIASQGAVQNFAAETPGRMAAAQAYLNRQITGGRQQAVNGGGMAFSSQPTTTRTAPSTSYDPGAIHRNAANLAFGGGQPVNLNRNPAPAPAPAPAPRPRPAPAPAVGGGSGYIERSGQPNTRITYQPPAQPAPKAAGNVIYRTPAQQQAAARNLSQGQPYQIGVPMHFPNTFKN